MYNSQRYLDPSSIISKLPEQISSLITCQICLGVAIQPLQCAKCQNLFCSHEIRQLKDKSCPICKQNQFKSVQSIHKSYRTILQTILIVCPNCSKQTSYSNYIIHLNDCKKKVSVEPIEKKTPFMIYFYQSEQENVQYEPLNIVSMNINMRQGVLQFRQGVYAIDLAAMIQTNTKTNFQRRIIAEVDQTHVEQPYWLLNRKDNPNATFEYQLQSALEQAYALWLSSGKSKDQEQYLFALEDKNYSVNFSTMVQKNLQTEYSRPIKRMII